MHIQSQSSSASSSSSDNEAPNVLSFWNAPLPPARPELTNVCRLSRNAEVVRMAHLHDLSVVDVAWEDMARDKHSSVGSNITDATLRVRNYPERCSILRPPNYTDKTGDFSIGQFQVKVGNEAGEPLRATPLRDYLNGLFEDAGGPAEVIFPTKEILVAPQTCVLPLDHGSCTFNMELFNYQTSEAFPAALAVVCTAEGTSAQIMTKQGAQKLFFNQQGRAADFVAERLKHVRRREGRALEGAMNAQEQERNILLLFQVPLKLPPKKPRPTFSGMPFPGSGYSPSSYVPAPGYAAGLAMSFPGYGAAPPALGSCVYGATRAQHAYASPTPVAAQGTDHAQLTVGPTHSAFAKLPERFELDPDAAIRCTVQHYLVTDEGTLSERDIQGVKEKMDAIYSRAERVGSLVVDGDAGTRSTAAKGRAAFWFFG